jgi:hypothetical protein
MADEETFALEQAETHAELEDNDRRRLKQLIQFPTHQIKGKHANPSYAQKQKALCGFQTRRGGTKDVGST